MPHQMPSVSSQQPEHQLIQPFPPLHTQCVAKPCQSSIRTILMPLLIHHLNFLEVISKNISRLEKPLINSILKITFKWRVWLQPEKWFKGKDCSSERWFYRMSVDVRKGAHSQINLENSRVNTIKPIFTIVIVFTLRFLRIFKQALWIHKSRLNQCHIFTSLWLFGKKGSMPHGTAYLGHRPFPQGLPFASHLIITWNSWVLALFI